jgi:DNA-directed RNA polymerase specialized sigma24 family protein
MSAIHDEEYAAVVERERPLIQATAYLLTGDPVQAERVVQLVLAQLYRRWSGLSQPRLEAIRSIVDAARAPVQLPWEQHKGFELIDGLPPVPAVEPIVTDLRRLSNDQRVAIVLDCYVGLTSAQIAQVLERPVGDVLSIAGRARNMLAADHPERMSDEALLQELKDAIPYDMREAHGSADDLAHGRRLARRRWIQRGSATLVAVVAIVVAVVMLVPTPSSVPQAAPPLPTPTQSRYSCDPSSGTCQAQILLKWRSRMAEVASSHLDPTGAYFSGYGYSYDGRYDTPTFWTGRGGALAFEIFRLDKGATEVWIQVATSREFAARCGATTRQKCMFVRFMDGNSFLMTDSTLAGGGIEVQYSPHGKEVITVIARNTQRGKTLKISTGDLIKLVQDDRLRLPQRCCYRR